MESIDDPPPSRRPTSLPPEEFRPAARSDYGWFAISVMASSALSAVVVYRLAESTSSGRLSGPRGLAAFWAVVVWLAPALRVFINWRTAVSAGMTDHSYAVRMWWHVQLALSVLASLVVMSLLLLLRALCLPF